MELVNLISGKQESFGDSEAFSALASGTHRPSDGLALINPNGQLVVSPENEVDGRVEKLGYKFPTQEQLTELSNQQKYGEGIGNEARAGLEGAARGATFGLSDAAQTALGVSSEGLKQRKERNPISSTVGEVGGAIGSALLAPELAPAGLVGKLGAGVAERLAPEILAEGAPIAQRILNAAGQVGAKAAGSAVEGAAYGLGQDVSEASLGDPSLNAEKLMANIGYGGLFGGALGGLLKAGELGIPKAGSLIGKAAEAVRDTTIGAPGEEPSFLGQQFADASAHVTGEDPEDILMALKNREYGAQSNSAVADLGKNLLYGKVLGGPLTAIKMAANALDNPYAAINRYANIERAAQKVTDFVSKASRSVFDPTMKLAGKSAAALGAEISTKNQEEQYDEHAPEVEDFNTAPSKTIEHLDLVTRDMFHIAPNTGSALQMAALRGNQFLAGKVPKSQTTKLPFDKPFKPTLPQMIKFNRYYHAVHRPLSSLNQLRDGYIHPETVEALETVYPQLYNEMKVEVMSAMTEHLGNDEDMSYQKRMALSTFLQAPLDSSMNPQNFTQNQQVIAQGNAGKKIDQQASASKVGNITLGDRLKTNFQDSAQRGAT